jgi:hypothetical protein
LRGGDSAHLFQAGDDIGAPVFVGTTFCIDGAGQLVQAKPEFVGVLMDFGLVWEIPGLVLAIARETRGQLVVAWTCCQLAPRRGGCSNGRGEPTKGVVAVRTTPNECWMLLHRLAASLDEEGLTRHERFDNLVHEFLAMPPLVRRELVRELRYVLCELTDLEPVVINATNAAEEKKKRATKTA